jgi:hypothetical protein
MVSSTYGMRLLSHLPRHQLLSGWAPGSSYISPSPSHPKMPWDPHNCLWQALTGRQSGERVRLQLKVP